MATIRDVGKLAGVSVATVSRVINENGYVNDKTKKAVMAAIEVLNYKPNAFARSLAGKSTGMVALIVPDIMNPFFPELARAIEDEAHKYGYTVILCNSDNDQDKEQKYFDIMVSKQVDGIIIASYTIQPEQLSSLQKKSIPVVLVDNYIANADILSFSSNNREGARLAVQHLLEKGCGKIAHICGPSHVNNARERLLAYEEIAKNESWYTPSLIIQSGFHVDEGYKAMMELHRRHPDIDGIFAGNDLIAIGALKALYKLGKSVPKDVKLIGFDGIALQTVVPELSTIAQPIYKMGKYAMSYLIKIIRKEMLDPKNHLFQTSLIARQST